MKINICAFNNIHPIHNNYSGILDQVECLSSYLESQSFDYQISYTLDPSALNLVIENFNEESALTIESFCNKWNKKILVIMTEHISLDLSMGDADRKGAIKFGSYDINNTDYIGNLSQRFYSLSMIYEHVVGFATIGELPFLNDLKKIFYVEKVYRFNYPAVINKKTGNYTCKPKYDISFSGFVTEYRSKVFIELGKKYKFKRYDIVEDGIKREENARTAKIAVNIPQEGDWPWVSPMRVVYYLSIGIPCVHIGKGDNTLFYDKVLSWVDIDQAIKSPDLVYKKQVDAYMNLSIDGGSLKSLFGVWNILENL